jgi:hypothetical protein
MLLNILHTCSVLLKFNDLIIGSLVKDRKCKCIEDGCRNMSIIHTDLLYFVTNIQGFMLLISLRPSFLTFYPFFIRSPA